VTALQRLQDAITKLEQLRSTSFPGVWEVLTSGIERGDHWFVTAQDEAILSISANDGFDEDYRRPTASLITTLHRTVDAQLSILAYGATLVGPIPGCILALADSILDGEQ
jgi:hypothetical protein